MTSKRDKDLIKKITEKRCIEWTANPLVNPVTDATIDYKGPTYNIFEKVCREKFNITLDGQASAASPSASAASPSADMPKLPKHVDDIPMPQTRKQWSENTLINTDFHKILLLITNSKTKFISEYVLENMLSYVKICELGLEYGLVPESDVEKIRDYIERFTHYSTKENLQGVKLVRKTDIDIIDAYLKNRCNITDLEDKRVAYPVAIMQCLEYKENELAAQCTSLQKEILRFGINDDRDNEASRIPFLLGTIMYYKLFFSDTDARIANWNTVYNPITTSESSVNVTMKYIELDKFIKEIKHLNEANNRSNKSLTSKSKSATLPGSISMHRSIRNIEIPPEPADVEDSEGRLYKKRTQGPVNLDQFSEYVQEVSTGRSSFKHHSLLSKMQPLSRASLDALPVKTRGQILKELKTTCNEMKDSITGKRFDRMSKKNLHLIVQIGPNAKKRCYYVRNIYKYWEKLAKDNIAFKEPETRHAVTAAEKADIMNKVKYLKKGTVDPDTRITYKKDPKLKMLIELDSTGRYYTFHVIRRIGSVLYHLLDLGVLPAHIDLTQAQGGTAYYSSEATVANVSEAFEKGRVLISNFVPYTCCRMHFKHKSYWEENPDEINHKFKLFADEAYGLL